MAHRSKSLLKRSLNHTHTPTCAVRARTCTGYDVCDCQPIDFDYGWISSTWDEHNTTFNNVHYSFRVDKQHLKLIGKPYTNLSEAQQSNFFDFFRVIVPYYQKNTVSADTLGANTTVLNRIPVQHIPFPPDTWAKWKKMYGWKTMKKWVKQIARKQYSILTGCKIANRSVGKQNMSSSKSRKRRKKHIEYGRKKAQAIFREFNDSIAAIDLFFTGSGHVFVLSLLPYLGKGEIFLWFSQAQLSTAKKINESYAEKIQSGRETLDSPYLQSQRCKKGKKFVFFVRACFAVSRARLFLLYLSVYGTRNRTCIERCS